MNSAKLSLYDCIELMPFEDMAFHTNAGKVVLRVDLSQGIIAGKTVISNRTTLRLGAQLVEYVSMGDAELIRINGRIIADKREFKRIFRADIAQLFVANDIN